MTMHHKPSSEPFWWALFGAGGTISALCVPVLLLLVGLAMPLGWARTPGYDEALALVGHPVARLFVLGVVALSMFHGAHRFRFTLYDGLQLKHLETLIAVLCYGGALLVTVLTALALWQL